MGVGGGGVLKMVGPLETYPKAPTLLIVTKRIARILRNCTQCVCARQTNLYRGYLGIMETKMETTMIT